MEFSDKLRMLIDEREITQKQLAADLKIPPSTLGGYVQGTSEPDFATLKELCEYFSVSADYFLNIRRDISKTEKEQEMLRVFRSLSDEQQDLYLEQGKVFIKLTAKKTEKSSKSILDSDNKAD